MLSNHIYNYYVHYTYYIDFRSFMNWFVTHQLLVGMPFNYYSTLNDSHRTATSEVVQAIKSVKETIEDCI